MWQLQIVFVQVGGAPYKEDRITLIQGGWLNSKLIDALQNWKDEVKHSYKS